VKWVLVLLALQTSSIDLWCEMPSAEEDVDNHFGIFATDMTKKIHIPIFLIRNHGFHLGFIFMVLILYN
jgi:hypothetical protein